MTFRLWPLRLHQRPAIRHACLAGKVLTAGKLACFLFQGFSALRGPFASSVIEQLLTGTAWGELDYLVIDLPPGTGDIHITLTQAVKIDACVVVTTLQALRWGGIFSVRMIAQPLQCCSVSCSGLWAQIV